MHINVEVCTLLFMRIFSKWASVQYGCEFSFSSYTIHNWIHIPRVRSVRQKIFNALTLTSCCNACAMRTREVFGEIVDNLYRFHEDEMGKKTSLHF